MKNNSDTVQNPTAVHSLTCSDFFILFHLTLWWSKADAEPDSGFQNPALVLNAAGRATFGLPECGYTASFTGKMVSPVG